MIDVHDVATRIINASRSPVPGNVALHRAVRAATEQLAACWDDCAATVLTAERSAAKTFPPDGEPGNWESMNPYRLALELTPDGPHAPRVEFVDEPDHDETADGNSVDGVWVVWRAHGDRSKGFTAIYPEDEEIEALRQVNADGFGVAEFIPFGEQIAN